MHQFINLQYGFALVFKKIKDTFFYSSGESEFLLDGQTKAWTK